MSDKVQVWYEATPNPQSMKFLVDRSIAEDSVNFTEATECQRSPLAAKIFGFPWTQGVFIGPQFVTVTKQDWVDWGTLAEPLSGLIAEHLQRGESVLTAAVKATANTTDANQESSEDSDVVKQIKQIINTEIRPAVAMDGGDIVFNKYEDNILYIHMQGACAGCPSSTMTLKMGIESRLKEVLPEIQEVIAL